jgi:glycine cleavage system H protein
MTDYLEYRIDKFIFRTATDRYYTNEGMWIKPENSLVRIGISDFLQQRSGDVAFVEVKPVGEQVANGEELVVIETIKVNISLTSPLSGKIIEANPMMEKTPEIINQDPYGSGWMVMVEPTDIQTMLEHLLDAQTYFAKVREDSEREVKKE